MRVIDRCLLFIFAVGMLMLSLFVLLLGLGFINHLQLLGILKYFFEGLDLWWLTIGASFILFLASFRVIILVFKRGKPRELGVDQITEVGPIRVSFETLQSLALNGARKVSGVRDSMARVRYNPDVSAVSIKVRVVIDGQNPIKEITEKVQYNVKEQVEKIAGISVNQVAVYVDQVIRPDRSRVRVQ